MQFDFIQVPYELWGSLNLILIRNNKILPFFSLKIESSALYLLKPIFDEQNKKR